MRPLKIDRLTSTDKQIGQLIENHERLYETVSNLKLDVANLKAINHRLAAAAEMGIKGLRKAQKDI